MLLTPFPGQADLARSLFQPCAFVSVGFIDALRTGYALDVIGRFELRRREWPAAGVTLHVAAFREIPVLFISARRRREDIVAGLAAGAVDFFPKPLDVGRLVCRIGELVDSGGNGHGSGSLDRGTEA